MKLVFFLILFKFGFYLLNDENILFRNDSIYLFSQENGQNNKISEGHTQNYLVARFPINKGFRKYDSQIKNFVEALNERPAFDGYIIYMSSRQVSKRQVDGYAGKFKLYLKTHHGVNVKRLVFKYGGKRDNADFDLYVVPPQPKSQ